MMKHKIWLVLIISLTSKIIFCQDGYAYRREIKGVKDVYHSIPFPNDLYKAFEKYNDFRILGITSKGDTVEAPYFFDTHETPSESGAIEFNLLNQSHNATGYFYTFEILNQTAINEIRLDFNDNNFDWKATLEGSNDQKDWFTILDNYRILGIKNDAVDYQYTTLRFPFAKYRYWRVCVKSATQPNFDKAYLNFKTTENKPYTTHNIKSTVIQHDKIKKQTLINVDLVDYVPISFLKIGINDKIDYIRNVHFYYQSDTTKPFRILTDANTVSSLDKNAYVFTPTFLKKIQIVIDNYDNVPLTITDITVKGNPHEFVARFTKSAQYYLYYGNPKGETPRYDIENFKNNISTAKTPLTLGSEESLLPAVTPSGPFFKNKWWLWGIMLLIMLGLGSQTLKMMQKRL